MELDWYWIAFMIIFILLLIAQGVLFLSLNGYKYDRKQRCFVKDD